MNKMNGLGILSNEAVTPETEEVEVVIESGEEAGLPAEDLKDETEVVDNDCETPEDKSKELEAELEDTVDGAGNEEISESEETVEEKEYFLRFYRLFKILNRAKIYFPRTPLRQWRICWRTIDGRCHQSGS